jgi:anti-sigma factor RsiW
MMIQYLLGELPETRQTHFEERLFTDSEFHAQLQIVEERLIDDYLRGRLSPERRERFRTHYLVSERRRQKVVFAQTLMQAIAELPAPARHESANWRQRLLAWRERPAAPRLAFAGLALLILIGGAWLAIETSRPRARQARLQSEAATLRQYEQSSQATSLPQSVPDVTSPTVETTQAPASSISSARPSIHVPSPAVILTQTLKPGRVRDAETQPGESERPGLFSIPPGTRLIRLRLELGDAAKYPTYRVTLMKAEGQTISLPVNLRLKPGSDGRTMVVELPAGLLARGDYVLTLLGVAEGGEAEELGDFYFTVLKP